MKIPYSYIFAPISGKEGENKKETTEERKNLFITLVSQSLPKFDHIEVVNYQSLCCCKHGGSQMGRIWSSGIKTY